MDILPLLKLEIEQEYHTTKKFIVNFPEGKNEYAPHEKSMKMMTLASHIVDIFGWPEVILNTDVLDFAIDNFMPPEATNTDGLKDLLDKNFMKGMKALNKIEERDLKGTWKLANNGYVLSTFTKYGALRHGLDQITHHRAQLGIYYRLLGIAVSSSYGPSADDQGF